MVLTPTYKPNCQISKLYKIRTSTWVALAVATLTEYPDEAFHSFRSFLDIELTSLIELEMTCHDAH